MGRIRSVHPDQWTDENFVLCTPLARLLALALRNEADDNGIFEWAPLKLKMRLLPADNCEVADLLTELESTGQVFKFEFDGREYGAIRSFHRFQSPRKPRARWPIPEQVPNRGYHFRYRTDASTEPVRNQCSTSTVPLRHGEGSGKGSGSGKGEGKGEGVREDFCPAPPQTGEPGPMQTEACDDPHTEPEPAVMTFPVKAPNGKPKTWALTESIIQTYADTFEDREWVEAELKKAWLWIDSNPNHRKTASGMKRFLSGWLTRANNRGNGKAKANAPSPDTEGLYLGTNDINF